MSSPPPIPSRSQLGKTKRRLRGLLFALSLPVLLGCQSGPAGSLHHFATTAPVVTSGELKVATYNIYFRTREVALTNAALKMADADVVALQEVTAESAQLLDRECCGNYPYRYFKCNLGLLSKYPLKNIHAERSNRGINGFIVADVMHPTGRVQVANLHLDPLHLWTAKDLAMLPLQFRRQRDIQRAELLQAFGWLKPDVPTIITGDFNRVSNDAVFRLRELGFTDSLATVTQKPDTLSTLHFSMLGMKLGRRIDYIFHDSHFQTKYCEVLPGKPSDHDVLVSRLTWNHTAVSTHKTDGECINSTLPGQ